MVMKFFLIVWFSTFILDLEECIQRLKGAASDVMQLSKVCFLLEKDDRGVWGTCSCIQEYIVAFVDWLSMVLKFFKFIIKCFFCFQQSLNERESSHLCYHMNFVCWNVKFALKVASEINDLKDILIHFFDWSTVFFLFYFCSSLFLNFTAKLNVFSKLSILVKPCRNVRLMAFYLH